jgi:hypothetical protein
MRLSVSQLTALRNLARKKEGEAVDWIRIADARALTDLGFAERGRAGWNISPAGLAAVAGCDQGDGGARGLSPAGRVIRLGAKSGGLGNASDDTRHN